MAEEIDDLYVKLGLRADEQQFQEAKSQFTSLRSVALQAGAAIGAGFGFRELTTGFSEAVDELSRFAEVYQADAEFVDRLGFAFRQVGGEASDAMSSIRRVADLIERTDWGEIPLDAFREAGFDARMLEGVDDIAEAYERLSEATRDMDQESARRALSALGFGEAEFRLFRGEGDEDLQALLADARDRAGLSSDMTEQARAFEQATNRLERSMTGISRELSSLFVGDLATNIDRMADLMSENRDAIVEFVDNALPYLKGAAAGIATLVALRLGRAALGVFSNIPGATAVAAGVGVGMKAYYDNREDMSPEERQENELDALESQIEQLRFNMDDLPAHVRQRHQEELEELKRRREQLRDSGVGSSGPDSTLFQGLDLTPDLPMREPSAGASGPSIDLDVTVDARGANDPAALRRAVDEGVDVALKRYTENTVVDFRSPIA